MVLGGPHLLECPGSPLSLFTAQHPFLVGLGDQTHGLVKECQAGAQILYPGPMTVRLKEEIYLGLKETEAWRVQFVEARGWK